MDGKVIKLAVNVLIPSICLLSFPLLLAANFNIATINLQKIVIVCFTTLLIAASRHSSFVNGQNLLSNRPQEYQLDRSTDSNAEAVATNSMSSLGPNEPSCEELRMMWRYVPAAFQHWLMMMYHILPPFLHPPLLSNLLFWLYFHGLWSIADFQSVSPGRRR